MKTCLVVVTYNRLEYTKKCLDYVLNDQISDFNLHIWDNGSTDGTVDYLMSLKDPRLKKVHLSSENVGQTVAMNRVWGDSKDKLVAKLDNDCLITEGWIKTLSDAHKDIPKLGAIACWPFRHEDFDEKVASLKIQNINGHKIFRHPFVCGSGFVMKRETYIKMKPWPEGSPNIGVTDYLRNMALNGYVNGWYYPLILQDHMDDPLSPNCLYHDEKSLQELKNITYSLRVFNISTMKDRMKRREKILTNLMYDSIDVRQQIGMRGKINRRLPFLKKLKANMALKRVNAS